MSELLVNSHPKFERWRKDPRLFVREVFRVTPDEWQDEILRDFPLSKKQAVKANKGPGKSTVEAWLAWNFLLTRPHPKVVATSISGDNLSDGLWTEMSKWQKKSPLLTQEFNWGKEKIEANCSPETWWMAARQWSRSATPDQQADTLAGKHADFIFFIIDEAGGVPRPVWAAAEAAQSTGIEVHLLVCGNPTDPQGRFYDVFTKERPRWKTYEVTGDPDDPKRSPRVSITWAREQIEIYGREHPFVLVNIFGQFPPAGSNVLIGVEEAAAASRLVIPPAQVEHEARILGVDVARFGDDRTVILPRQGPVAFRPKVFRNLDTMSVADQTAFAIDKWDPDAVFVDEGGLGAGVVDRLRQLGHDVVGVNFGSAALDSRPKLADRRTEMWWRMADWVKRGGSIPDDPALISELTAPTYKFQPDNSIRLESKDDLKKKGLPSPDIADALALTFAAPVRSRKRDRQPGYERPSTQAKRSDDPFSRAV